MSWVTAHVMSDGSRAGGLTATKSGTPAPPGGSTGSCICNDSMVNVMGSGGTHVLGQSFPATLRRREWPAANTHEVASISTSTAYRCPGSSGCGGGGRGGRVPQPGGGGGGGPPRWVRFNKPRVTRADVPSGHTSFNFTDRYAIGRSDVTVVLT